MSQIFIQLMRVRSLSIVATAAFEQGNTTDINVLSMQLLETSQKKMLNARRCLRYLPLLGFLPFTACYSEAIFPYLRPAAWDISSQKILPCISKTQAEVTLL